LSSEPKIDGATLTGVSETVLNARMWAMQRIPLFDPVRPALTLLEFG
jgi:hypothetical protein